MGQSLIEEALTDAEQVRETALANAKAQLEEAFTPRIESMVSKHLKEETELDEEETGYDEDGTEMNDPLEEEEDEYDDEDMEDDEDEEEIEEEMGDAEEDEDGSALPDPTNADDASLDEEEDEFDDEEADDMDDEDEEDVDLDLESVIAELEAEVNEEETGYDDDGEKGKDPLEEEEEEEMGSDEDEEDEDEEIVDLDELLKSLTEEEDEDESEEDDEEDMEYDDEEEEEMEETLDLEELFNSLEEGENNDEEVVETLTAENEKLTSENAEYREAVEILRSKLNEVNLLNAKLLYTSKLFKKYNLNNSQKMKVVESFDRTKSVRETKLVYSTLAESFQFGGSSKKKSKRTSSLTEGLASKPVKSTKPSNDGEIIKESNDIANRFKKLVNYNK